jgi:hypothetical protein
MRVSDRISWVLPPPVPGKTFSLRKHPGGTHVAYVHFSYSPCVLYLCYDGPVVIDSNT